MPSTTMRHLASPTLALLLASCTRSPPPSPVVEAPSARPTAVPEASAPASAALSASPAVESVWHAEIPKPPAAHCGGAVKPPPTVTLKAPPWKPQAAAPTGATARACQALEKDRKTRIAAISKDPFGMDEAGLAQWRARWRSGFLRCSGTGNGAWAIDVDTTATGTHRWMPVYIGADGRASRATPAELGDDQDLAIQGTFDFDGDGGAEAVVAHLDTDMEGAPRTTFEIYRAGAGKVDLFPPTEKLRIKSVEDVDGDGRPDLLVPSRYRFPSHEPNDGDSPDAVGVPEILHARPGGGISGDDAVAREFARLLCEKIDASANMITRKEEGALHIESWKLADWVACSRLWGVEAETLRGQIRQRFPAAARGMGEPVVDEVCEAAKVAPPFTLAPPCVP